MPSHKLQLQMWMQVSKDPDNSNLNEVSMLESKVLKVVVPWRRFSSIEIEIENDKLPHDQAQHHDYSSFLPVACQLVKRYCMVRDLCVSVAIKNAETLTFNFIHLDLWGTHDLTPHGWHGNLLKTTLACFAYRYRPTVYIGTFGTLYNCTLISRDDTMSEKVMRWPSVRCVYLFKQ
jgi:hypothetical protein